MKIGNRFRHLRRSLRVSKLLLLFRVVVKPTELEKEKTKLVVPEQVLVKILCRLSLSSIARFRSVCKEWKSLIDSDFFRDLYESLNSSSSVSWSLLQRWKLTPASLEIIGHHGCERWGLTNTLGSWIKRYTAVTTVRRILVLNCADGLVLLYSETSEGSPMYHVGNPLLKQWSRIPLPPHLSAFDVVRLQENFYFCDSGLVTKMEMGIVVGYKVVWVLGSRFSLQPTLMIYSSETGLWKTSKVCYPTSLTWSRQRQSVSLNGILHRLASIGIDLGANCVVSYDLEECCVIPFPDMDQQYETHRRFKRTITTSSGSLVYCNVFSDDDGGCTIRVWKLVKYCNLDPVAAWKLVWEVNTNSSLVGFCTDYFPVVMHPLNYEIIYLWSRNKNGLVLLNLRTHKFSLHEEEEENESMDGCIMRLTGCKEHMDTVYSNYVKGGLGGIHIIYFLQFVLPRWLNPLPQLSF